MVAIPPYEAYLFDLDGTLIDTAPDLMHALNATLSHAGYEQVDLALTRHWVGHGAKVMLAQALDHQNAQALADAELEILFQFFLERYGERIADASVPYAGVVESLQALRARTWKLGVVTNKRQDLSMQLLRELDLYQYFNIVVGGDTLQVRKPEPQPVLYACNELEAAAEETLFVGDSTTDVAAARAAGCPVVCVRDGYNQGAPASSLGADHVIDSFCQLV